MQYVVVIETDDGNAPNYKVFSNSADAVKRYNVAVAAQSSGKPIKVAGELTNIVSCDLFRANTRSVNEAVQLVKGGLAERYKPLGVPDIDDL